MGDSFLDGTRRRMAALVVLPVLLMWWLLGWSSWFMRVDPSEN